MIRQQIPTTQEDILFVTADLKSLEVVLPTSAFTVPWGLRAHGTAMLENPGIRYLLAALSLASIVTSFAWWRARDGFSLARFRSAAVWTSLSFALATVAIAFIIVGSRLA